MEVLDGVLLCFNVLVLDPDFLFNLLEQGKFRYVILDNQAVETGEDLCLVLQLLDIDAQVCAFLVDHLQTSQNFLAPLDIRHVRHVELLNVLIHVKEV